MPNRRQLVLAGLLATPLVGGLVAALRTTGLRATARPALATHPGAAAARGVDTAPGAAPPGTGAATPTPHPGGPAPSHSAASPRPSTARTGPLGTQRLTGSSAVALTFDDGPDPVYTPQLLDLLKEQDVRASFTVIGSRARDYSDVIKRIAAEGHTLCSHSWQHLMDLGTRDFGYQSWDLKSTNYAIQAAVPGAQVKYFRAPGGNYTQGLIDLATSIGMKSIYWDVDPRDWDSAQFGHGEPMVEHIIRVVQHTVRPGSIVLSHDRVRPDTIAAYRTLLPWLKERYRLIPLP
jgi:peptidoglycan/xylan/chitin deacetylase (PgdA/CDA1 family)